MTDPICWVHDEMLGAHCVPAGVPAIFVFDDAWLEAEQVSLKRVVFMYECVVSMNQDGSVPVEVHKGDPVEEVAAFADRHRRRRVVTHRSPLPRIKRQIDVLSSSGLEVDLIGPEPIVTLPDSTDLKRFSRYWRKAEKQVMRQD